MTTMDDLSLSMREIVLKPRHSIYDMMHLFYNRKDITPEQKCRIAIRKQYIIPAEFVMWARRMYIDGVLGKDYKKYFISNIFKDDDMIPFDGHPNYEYNPNFPLEYPRKKAGKMIVLEKRERRYVEVFDAEYLKLLKNVEINKKAMVIPEYQPKPGQISILEVERPEIDEETERLLKFLKKSKKGEIQKYACNIKAYNPTQCFNLNRMKNPYSDKPKSNCAQIEIKLEKFGESKKIVDEMREKKKMEELSKENQKWWAYTKNSVLRNRKYFDVHATRRYLDRLEEERKTKIDEETRKNREPMVMGKEADEEILRQLMDWEAENADPKHVSSSDDSSSDDETTDAESDNDEEHNVRYHDMMNYKQYHEKCQKMQKTKTITESTPEPEDDGDDEMSDHSLSKSTHISYASSDQNSVAENPCSDIVEVVENQLEIQESSKSPEKDQNLVAENPCSDSVEVVENQLEIQESSNSPEKDQNSVAENPCSDIVDNVGNQIQMQESCNSPEKATEREESVISPSIDDKEGKDPDEAYETTSTVTSSSSKKSRGRPKKRPVNRRARNEAEQKLGRPKRDELSPEAPVQEEESTAHVTQTADVIEQQPDLMQFMPPPPRKRRAAQVAMSMMMMMDTSDEEEEMKRARRGEDGMMTGSDSSRRGRRGARRNFISMNNQSDDDDMEDPDDHPPVESMAFPVEPMHSPVQSMDHEDPEDLEEPEDPEEPEEPEEPPMEFVEPMDHVDPVDPIDPAGPLESTTEPAELDHDSSPSPEVIEMPPKPVIEITIDDDDEEEEERPDEDMQSQLGMKWKDTMRARHGRANDVQVLFANIEPKIELSDDEVIAVSADYQLTKEPRKLTEEVGVTLPCPKYRSGMEVTHNFVLNHGIYKELNELFVTDADKFCKLIALIIADENGEQGLVYSFNVDTVSLKHDFSEKFVRLVATTPKDSIYSKLRSYTEFTREFLSRCYLLSANRDIKIGGKFFYAFVENLQEKMRRFRNCLPAHIMSTGEHTIVADVETRIIDRFIETTLKMSGLGKSPGADEAHFRRRLELLIRGWEEFVRKGGVMRVILEMAKEEDRNVSKKFTKICKGYLKQSKADIKAAMKLLKLSEAQFVKRTLKELGLKESQGRMMNADMEMKPDETHVMKCDKCRINETMPVYFSSRRAYQLHDKLHEGTECPMCFDDIPTPTAVLLHNINEHWSIVNDYND